MAQTTLKLRDYQVNDVESIENAFTEFRSVLYQLPTGGGKSVIFSKIIQDYKKENILVFAHKKKLLKQIKERLEGLGIKPGIMMGLTQENINSNILLVSIRSAVKAKRLEWLIKKNWDRCIIDEARHSRTGSYDVVLDKLLEVHPTYKLLGVDATPYRKDKKRLDKHFQTLVKSCETVKTLQEKGYLCNIKTYATPIGEIEKEVKTVANDYQQGELSDYMCQQKYLDYVVNAYAKYGEKKQAIVFAVDKAHSKALRDAFIAKGYKKVAQIDSDLSDEEIDKAYEDYENKKIDILINVEMITEGVDLPETKVLVGARPTKSLTLYLQMGGRLMRPKEDGSDGILIDCAGWTEEFGALNSTRDWSLDPEVDPNDPRKKNRIVGKDKNGNLTTNVDEMDEFTELVEMTPEEYIMKVSGGLKEAAKTNMSIDQKIDIVKKDLEELLHKAALKSIKEKVSPFTCHVRQDEYDKAKLVAYFFHVNRLESKTKKRKSEDGDEQEQYDTWSDGTHVVIMDLQKKENMYATLSDEHVKGNSWYSVRKEDKTNIPEFREMARVCGEVNMMIVDNKNLMMQILEKYQQIHDLEKTKINLSEYKDLQKKLEADKWKQDVIIHAGSNGTFVLPNRISEDNHFKTDRYSSTNYILEITIPSGKINEYHNTIQLKMTNRYNNNTPYMVEKKYVKGEKVYEIIKESKWTAETASVSSEPVNA